MHKVCIIDNQSQFPAFRVREYFDSLNIDCFILNNSNDGYIDIKLFVCDKDEVFTRVLLEMVSFIKTEDGCPMCGASNYISKINIIHKLFHLRKNYNNFCRHCKFKW